jgi:8-oxo-dGTP pyrophosphatase MutT (NUDIX family)
VNRASGSAQTDKVIEMKHRLAAGALVVENDRLLLVHHFRPGVLDFWIPPGGGVMDGEELPVAAVREVAEETGLVVEALSLAYIDELLISDTRQCKFWFMARRLGGSLSALPEAARAEYIVETAFLSRAEMVGKIVFPSVVVDEFWTHLQDGFAQPRFLGVREAVIPFPA